MLIPVLLALVSPPSPAPILRERPRPLAPAVQVWLSDRKTSKWGVRARAYARPSADGYLVVLYTNAAGQVRVLFPQSPQESQFVYGGQIYGLGAGSQAVDDSDDNGIVLAAISSEPFAVDRYVRNGQWELPSTGLLDLARSMQPGGDLHYDMASYAAPSRQQLKKNSSQYAQRDSEQSARPLRQQGKVYYPFAYGYSSIGGFSFRGGLNSGALLSFPYRYDQFYRGARKVWW